MRFSSFKYLVKQGFKSIWVNRLMSVASIGVLTACLLLTGSAFLFSLNVGEIVGYVEGQNEVVLILYDNITTEQKDALESDLKQMDNVNSVTYISKEQALENEKKEFGSLLEGLDETNPLPATFRIKLKDLAILDTTVSKLSGYTQIEQIKAPTDIANTLTSIKRMVSIIGFAIVITLSIVSLVIISNTIKLSVFNRRKEVNIMKFVGATDKFIKFPFVVEGISLGLISASLSFGVIYFGYSYIIKWLTQTQSSWLMGMTESIIPFSEIGLYVFGAFCAVGIITGILGSAVSLRKHLKV